MIFFFFYHAAILPACECHVIRLATGVKNLLRPAICSTVNLEFDGDSSSSTLRVILVFRLSKFFYLYIVIKKKVVLDFRLLIIALYCPEKLLPV